MTENMPCRNEDCRLYNDKCELNCKRPLSEYKNENYMNEVGVCDAQVTWICPIYTRLLPLWEFRDKWESRTKSGCKYEIHKKIDYFYTGIVYPSFMGGWKVVEWDESGFCISQPNDFGLVPKKITQSKLCQFNSFQELVDAVAEKLKK